MQPSRIVAVVVLALPLGAPVFGQSGAPNRMPDGLRPPAASTSSEAALPSPNASLQQPTDREPHGRPHKVAGAFFNILVYDENSNNSSAALAAQDVNLLGTHVAGAADFNFWLTSQAWEVVLVDCPSTIPDGGWSPLMMYVHNGGAAVMSYWDWDDSDGSSFGLAATFHGVVTSSFTWSGKTLADSGTSGAFVDVDMPHSTWSDAWLDDGDVFAPFGGAEGIAHTGVPSQPVMVRGNGGRTIAAPVFDEWPQSGGFPLVDVIQLWENLIFVVTDVGGPDILVFDHDTNHQLAAQAAFDTSAGGTVKANRDNFNSLLTGKTWDAVLVDCPGSIPTGGWGPLIARVNAGGNAVMSFWDWDNDALGGDPALPPAFDVSVASSFSWNGLTLTSSGVIDVFSGVFMPASSWHDHWADDGDRFLPVAPAKGLAHVGNPAQPVMVYGNAGRTIAAPAFDESGDLWLTTGSDVNLWQNMLAAVTEPKASCTVRTGVLGLNPNDYVCLQPPVMGGTLTVQISTTPTLGTATLSTFIGLGLGGPIQGLVALGHELLILPPFLQFPGFGIHNIPVTQDPAFVGIQIATQGARLETNGPTFFVVLTNAIDILHGF